MAKRKPDSNPSPAPAAATEYTVVARRYRPQQFAELIGQEHVAGALVHALESGRVAHAYLFTGARGVGKTSAARILAKALNCEKGPTATPCDACESCKAIAEGQDVDVSEIDGASNRGIEDARELRQNVGFRPTRGRYKIYIIDEVHMLTKEAFNALLKTLEEPPPHVKFIFATTDVQKLPVTILSRCQRFDFSFVGPAKIFEQLKSIVQREHYEADEDALKLIARRAAGSMRDSQSLLDQLLASAAGRLTLERVHAVLGSTGDERVVELAAAILAHDAKTALNLIGRWVDHGLQISELIDQLVEYWRALMLVNCAPDLPDVPIAPNQREALDRQARDMTLDAILSGLDIWTTTKARLRGSNHAQVLLEMAVVRLSRLEELLSVGQLTQALMQSGNGAGVKGPAGPGRPAQTTRLSAPNGRQADEAVDLSKKNGMIEARPRTELSSPSPANETLALTDKTLPEIWERMLSHFSSRAPLLAGHLKSAGLPAIFGPNSLAIRFPSHYSHAYDAVAAEPALARIRETLQQLTGHPVVVKPEQVATAASQPATAATPVRQASDRRKQLMDLPLFKRAGDVLGAQIWHVDENFDPDQARPAVPTPTASEDDDAPDPDED